MKALNTSTATRARLTAPTRYDSGTRCSRPRDDGFGLGGGGGCVMTVPVGGILSLCGKPPLQKRGGTGKEFPPRMGGARPLLAGRALVSLTEQRHQALGPAGSCGLCWF